VRSPVFCFLSSSIDYIAYVTQLSPCFPTNGHHLDERLEGIVREHKEPAAKEIGNAILDYALKQDEYFQQIREEDRIDDKTALIIKHSNN
jgi:hypothetical protein